MTEKKQFNYHRPEYPRPILKRDQWLNLNGRWDFFAGNTDQDPVRAIVSEEIGHKTSLFLSRQTHNRQESF